MILCYSSILSPNLLFQQLKQLFDDPGQLLVSFFDLNIRLSCFRPSPFTKSFLRQSAVRDIFFAVAGPISIVLSALFSLQGWLEQ